MTEENVTLEYAFKNATVGLTSSKRSKGVRLLPYCEIRSKYRIYLSRLKAKLLTISVSSTVRKGFLRIQGIQNCNLITQFISTQWWLESMEMFMEGKHLTEEGLLTIAKLRDDNYTGRKILTRRNVGDVAQLLAES